MDNTDAKTTGKWAKSSGVPNHVGSEYLYSNTSGSKVIYPVKFSKGGKYAVRISGAQHPNRAPKALVTVLHNDGSKSFRLDQRKSPGAFNKAGSDGYFQSLGFYEFPSGQWDAVEISTKGGGGFVVADAVQFLPVDNDGNVTIPQTSQQGKELSPAEQKELKARMARLTTDLSALQKRKPAPEMVNSAVEKKKPTDMKIHVRGSIYQLGAIAPRGVLQVANYGPVPKMPTNASGRLELADWVADPANPLTARVMANRVWHWLIRRRTGSHSR